MNVRFVYGTALGLTVAVVATYVASRRELESARSSTAGGRNPDSSTLTPQRAENPVGALAPFLEIARVYESYQRVNELAPHWAPADCAMSRLSPVPPTMARFSKIDDGGTHGRKLYFLFASNRDAYSKLEKESQPVGQVLVKESWRPVKVDSKRPRGKESTPLTEQVYPFPSVGIDVIYGRTKDTWWPSFPYATIDGVWYCAQEKSGLFIMTKLDPRTPDTDDGWVYGTVSPDGKRVTTSGRVTSCMECHRESSHDRMLGTGSSVQSRRAP